jgi:hypothetical protein
LGEGRELVVENVDLVTWLKLGRGGAGVVVIKPPPGPDRPAPARIFVAAIHSTQDTTAAASWRAPRI